MSVSGTVSALKDGVGYDGCETSAELLHSVLCANAAVRCTHLNALFAQLRYQAEMRYCVDTLNCDFSDRVENLPDHKRLSSTR